MAAPRSGGHLLYPWRHGGIPHAPFRVPSEHRPTSHSQGTNLRCMTALLPAKNCKQTAGDNESDGEGIPESQAAGPSTSSTADKVGVRETEEFKSGLGESNVAVDKESEEQGPSEIDKAVREAANVKAGEMPAVGLLGVRATVSALEKEMEAGEAKELAFSLFKIPKGKRKEGTSNTNTAKRSSVSEAEVQGTDESESELSVRTDCVQIQSIAGSVIVDFSKDEDNDTDSSASSDLSSNQ
ncbi:UNVERIFIED_CONTAM: hypothetical protein FKN15_077156 [Acipenser sinensis]